MSDGESGLHALERAIFMKKPALGRVLAEHGDRSLAAYARTLSERTRSIDAARQDECITEIAASVGRTFGPQKAASAARQLKEHYYVSTTDHHGPLTHPFFVHADLLAASPYAGERDPAHENLIVLACSNTSLGNSSSPRGLLFHGGRGSGYDRIPFFAASDRAKPVFGFRAYTQKDMARARASLSAAADTGAIETSIARETGTLLSEIYEDPAALAEASYAGQVTRTNAVLWRRFFDASDALPDLLYLEQEAVVNALLSRHHLHADTELHRFIFDRAIRERAALRFDGIPGCFALDGRKGTFLFWLLPEEGPGRVALWPDGDRLVSEDRAYELSLDPAAIQEHLDAGRLIPSMMLSLVTLSSYYGLRCLGGFSQVDYLSRMEQAYAEVMGMDEPGEDDAFARGFCGDLVIQTASLPSSELVPATGIDIALCSAPGSWERFSSSLGKLTLRQSFGMMLPELYGILYREDERDAGLAAVTQRDLIATLESTGVLAPAIPIANGSL
jgi:hypothetical protein